MDNKQTSIDHFQYNNVITYFCENKQQAKAI